jgi:P-type Cu2+ transporter
MTRSAHQRKDHGRIPHANMGHVSPLAQHHMDMGHGRLGNGHAAMVTDFRDRFWVSMILTVPVLALSPLVQDLLGLRERFAFGESLTFSLVFLPWSISTAAGLSSRESATN